MTESNKVADYLRSLEVDKIITEERDPYLEPNERVYTTPAKVLLQFQHCEVVQICVTVNEDGEFVEAMVVASEGSDHFLEEVLTEADLKDFEIYDKR